MLESEVIDSHSLAAYAGLPPERALFSTRDLLSSSLDFSDTVEQVARLAVPRLAEQCTIYLLEGPTSLRAVAVTHADPQKEAAAREIRRSYPVDPSSDHVVARVVREGRARVLSSIDESAWERSARDARHLELLGKVQHRSGLVVPLEARGQTIGAISFATSDTQRRFTAGDLVKAEDMARWAAMAIDNARLHQELLRSRERYRAFITNSTEGIWRLELERPVPVTLPEEEQIARFFELGYLAECNDAMARMYGYSSPEELLGARLSDLLPPTDPHNRNYLLAVIRSGYRLTDAESHEIDRDGNPRIFLNSLVASVEDGCVCRAWGTQRDITERKQFEERLRRAERLDVVGRLAGGVAHDFNNMLGVILGYSDLCLQIGDLTPSLREALVQIRSAGARAATLTSELLAFGQKQFIRPRTIDLNGFLGAALPEIQNAAGPLHSLEFLPDANAPMARVDPSHLTQIVCALVSNAADDVPEGGRIRLATSVEAHRMAADHSSRRLIIAISDNGPGLDEGVCERLFEPFYSTKSLGRGHGLGLAAIHGLVEQNGGTIEVESHPVRGTTFRVLLPEA